MEPLTPGSHTMTITIKATAERGTLSMPYDHALNADGNHEAAANALLQKLTGQDAPKVLRASGSLPRGAGRVFIFTL